MTKGFKACTLMLLMASFIVSGSAQVVKAEVTNNNWATEKMEEALKETKPIKAAIMGVDKRSSGLWNMSPKSSYYAIPIEITHDGNMFITVSVDSLKDGSINCGLYKDAGMTKGVGKTPSINKRNTIVTSSYNVVKGTYYFAMEKQGGCRGIGLNGTISAVNIRNGNRNIGNNDIVYSYFEHTDDKLYYKLNIESDGVLTVTFNKGITITLCDSEKGAITYSQAKGAGDVASYGLKKGTYYLKVTDVKDILELKTEFKEQSLLSGGSYKGVSTNKEYELTVPIDGNVNDMYSLTFKLEEDTELGIKISNRNIIGRLNITVVYAGDKKEYFNDYYIGNGKSEAIVGRAGNKKWPAGTYYINVSKYNGLSSGTFKLAFEK